MRSIAERSLCPTFFQFRLFKTILTIQIMQSCQYSQYCCSFDSFSTPSFLRLLKSQKIPFQGAFIVCVNLSFYPSFRSYPFRQHFYQVSQLINNLHLKSSSTITLHGLFRIPTSCALWHTYIWTQFLGVTCVAFNFTNWTAKHWWTQCTHRVINYIYARV